MAHPKPDKQIVEEGYDKIASAHHEWTRDKHPHRMRYADDLVARLPPDATVLDLGCGAGVPVLEKLVQHASKVHANDISSKQIEMARSHCPQATFHQEDMTKLEFQPASFDGVAAFFSIFHLPRDEQPAMLSHVFEWTKEGGHLAFNLAASDSAEIRMDFLGADMFWSSFDVERSKRMVLDAGFELLKAEVLDAGQELKPDDPDQGIMFLYMLARKPERRGESEGS